MMESIAQTQTRFRAHAATSGRGPHGRHCTGMAASNALPMSIASPMLKPVIHLRFQRVGATPLSRCLCAASTAKSSRTASKVPSMKPHVSRAHGKTFLPPTAAYRFSLQDTPAAAAAPAQRAAFLTMLLAAGWRTVASNKRFGEHGWANSSTSTNASSKPTELSCLLFLTASSGTTCSNSAAYPASRPAWAMQLFNRKWRAKI